MGVLGGVFVLKSGLRILIRTPEVPFLVPPKTPKMGVFGYFGGTKNGTWGARIKILRPLFNTNTPLKPPFRHFGNRFGPQKSDFWPFYFFGHFPIEIPMHLQICIFRPQGVLKSKKIQKKPTLKFNFTLKNM